MKSYKQFIDEAKGDLKDACWKGYKAVGMKDKGGRKVPNCVPEEVEKKPEDIFHPGPAANEKYVLKQIQKQKQKKEKQVNESAAWQRKEGKSESGGLNQKGVDSYRKEHPGSKLKTAVTTKPSKLKPGSKAANRRKSFCARMSGMKKRLTSAETARDPDSRINKSLRKWNC